MPDTYPPASAQVSAFWVSLGSPDAEPPGECQVSAGQSRSVGRYDCCRGAGRAGLAGSRRGRELDGVARGDGPWVSLAGAMRRAVLTGTSVGGVGALRGMTLATWRAERVGQLGRHRVRVGRWCGGPARCHRPPGGCGGAACSPGRQGGAQRRPDALSCRRTCSMSSCSRQPARDRYGPQIVGTVTGPRAAGVTLRLVPRG